jgi:predicted GTPase
MIHYPSLTWITWLKQYMFDNSMAGFDHLDVSRRSSQVTDFRLTDGHGNTISLKISHWSMSGIFQKRA